MTGPKGNIEVEAKQNSLFPAGPAIKCFVTHSTSKIEKNYEDAVCLMSVG